MTTVPSRGRAALRRAGAHPRLIGSTALLLRARTVQPAAAFAIRELLAPALADGHRPQGQRLSVYTVRESGMRVALRHGTGDVVTLGHVFHDRDHDPPAGELAAALADVRTVVDLGANVGMFGLFAAHRWPGATIAALEPDPANASVHEHTIALNGMGDRWKLTRAAAGASAGRVRFITGGIALSRLAPPGDLPPDRQAAVDLAEAPGSEGERLIEVEQVDVVPQLADVDLVKLDIEGGEWAILQDARFRESPPRAVVLEYHPRFCPSGDARDAATTALQAAGLQVLPVVHRPDGHGTLWAWRA